MLTALSYISVGVGGIYTNNCIYILQSTVHLTPLLIIYSLSIALPPLATSLSLLFWGRRCKCYIPAEPYPSSA
ncbi:hypothetical protein BC629DRAFT_1554013 [Irpex lacteus]|nr:hypothetical protein BC629DRAFT_1554013 [Irpex lacteus]